LLAAWGMGLIIVGVAFFLVRDLRRQFEQIDLFFDRLEGRFRYVPFIAPASALLGVFLILLAFVFNACVSQTIFDRADNGAGATGSMDPSLPEF
jgi:hypothetical protein